VAISAEEGAISANDGPKQERPSFLKKRSKKLLRLRLHHQLQLARNPIDKSFLVLFFKKELLPAL
jgi:hypothetical protein